MIRIAALISALVLGAVFSGCGSNNSLGIQNVPLAPDLLPCGIEFDPATPTAEEQLNVSITVANRGAVDARSFRVRVFLVLAPCTPAQAIVGNQTFTFETGLRQGETGIATFVFNLANQQGAYGVFISVDDNLRIIEGNEANNFINCANFNNGCMTLNDTFLTVLGADTTVNN